MSHSHPTDGAESGRRLAASIALTLAFVLGEAVAGYVSHSLALISDAGHNFADALALFLSWYALRMARRPADARRTYGYHRAGILAALVNAVSLVLIALYIFWEAAPTRLTREGATRSRSACCVTSTSARRSSI
jgi:cobalt-zinc-cadmium efflux system protein